MIHTPWLNLYLYPSEVDYPRSMPLGPTWHNLESSVRTTDAGVELPPSWPTARARWSTSASVRWARGTCR